MSALVVYEEQSTCSACMGWGWEEARGGGGRRQGEGVGGGKGWGREEARGGGGRSQGEGARGGKGRGWEEARGGNEWVVVICTEFVNSF